MTSAFGHLKPFIPEAYLIAETGMAKENLCFLFKKSFNKLQTPFHMTPRPINAFAYTARAKFIVGFPDVIRHPAENDLFVDPDNRRIAVQADRKHTDVFVGDRPFTDNLSELLIDIVGFVFDAEGLIADISLKGAKFSKVDKK